MIHKNWAELIKPTQLEVKPGNDPARQATVIAEPLERGFGELLLVDHASSSDKSCCLVGNLATDLERT